MLPSLKSMLLIKSEGGKVTRNSTLSLLDTVFTVLAYFFVMRQLVQTSGLEALGLWSITMGFLAFLRMLDQGGAGSVTRFVAAASADPDEQARLIDSACLFSVAFFVVVALLGYVPVSFFLQDSVKGETWRAAHSLLIGLLTVLPLNMMVLGQLAAINGIGRADIRAVINIVATLLYVLVALTLMSDFGVMALVLGQFAQYTLALLASRAMLRMKVSGVGFFPARISSRSLRSLVGFGARLQVAIIPIHFFHSLNRILIGRFVGLELLAVYELAYRFATSARQFIQALLNPMLPEFARLMVSGPARAKERFSQVAPLAVIGAASVSTAQLFATPFVSYVMLGRLEYTFILVSSCFTLAWGFANIGLTSQLYSRAAGLLRWAMVGQWGLLAMGVALIYVANMGLGELAVLVAPAVAILLGYLIAMTGENCHFGLNPFLAKRRLTVIAALSTFALAAIAAILLSATALNNQVLR